MIKCILMHHQFNGAGPYTEVPKLMLELTEHQYDLLSEAISDNEGSHWYLVKEGNLS